MGAIALISLGIIAAVTGIAVGGAWWQVTIALLLSIVPALTVAVSLVNWAVTQFLPPHTLPKLEFEEGVPASARTLVVIPALLSRPQDVDDLCRQLEMHYLRNTDPNGTVRFALLTDFSDADAETMPEDAELLAPRDTRTVEELNQRYPDEPFYFFHRRRLWNPSEGAWMGWERKRGKLHELNGLLRSDLGDPQRHHGTSYTTLVGKLAKLAGVRYVITLDADTVLPRDAARRLIATLAHPLNVAEFDPVSGRVASGYTVLQPRTEINVASVSRSLFSRIYAGRAGIDLYTLAVSDVYQDLFGEGVFVGKGIYDVDAFERSLHGRVPENALLSHDLFEGIHGRAGLVTDIVLFEDFPDNYLANLWRVHRWVRGDWQLLPWLANKVFYAGKRADNSLPLIARWKIFDNLRRSLLSPVLLVWFIAGWTVLPGAAWLWTLLGVITPGIPVLTDALAVLARMTDRSRIEWGPLLNRAVRWLLLLVSLPLEASANVHAITVTLLRLAVWRRNLLEWTTAARAARLLRDDDLGKVIVRQVLPSLLLVGLIAPLTFWLRPRALFVAVPLWLAWVVAPAISYFLSRPRQRRAYVASEADVRRLHALARRTWFFYEQMVGPEDRLVAAGPFPGIPQRHRGASDLPDERRPLSALCVGRPRSGLYQHGQSGAAAALRVRCNGATRTSPGASRQLVRHPRPDDADARLYFDRGFRQPGRGAVGAWTGL